MYRDCREGQAIEWSGEAECRGWELEEGSEGRQECSPAGQNQRRPRDP